MIHEYYSMPALQWTIPTTTKSADRLPFGKCVLQIHVELPQSSSDHTFSSRDVADSSLELIGMAV